jgi:hypothetical protein
MYRNLFRRSAGPSSQASSFRPRLECLEDRDVPSTTVLTVVPNPGTVGQQVTLTATVTETGTDSVAPGNGFFAKGTVTFYDGIIPLATVTVTNSGSNGGFSNQGGAVFTTTTGLAFGSHALSAYYSGDYAHLPYYNTAPSNSGVLNASIGLPLDRIAFDAFVSAAGLMTQNVGLYYAGMSDYLTMVSLVPGPQQQQLAQNYFMNLFNDLMLLSSTNNTPTPKSQTSSSTCSD